MQDLLLDAISVLAFHLRFLTLFCSLPSIYILYQILFLHIFD